MKLGPTCAARRRHSCSTRKGKKNPDDIATDITCIVGSILSSSSIHVLSANRYKTDSRHSLLGTRKQYSHPQGQDGWDRQRYQCWKSVYKFPLYIHTQYMYTIVGSARVGPSSSAALPSHECPNLAGSVLTCLCLLCFLPSQPLHLSTTLSLLLLNVVRCRCVMAPRLKPARACRAFRLDWSRERGGREKETKKKKKKERRSLDVLLL